MTINMSASGYIPVDTRGGYMVETMLESCIILLKTGKGQQI